MIEILTRLATLPVIMVMFFALCFIFIFLYVLALEGCNKIFFFILSLIPKKITESAIRISSLFWVSFKKTVLRIITLIMAPVICLLSFVFRSLRFLWKKYRKLGETYSVFFVIPIISLYVISPFIVGWIWSIYSPTAFGGWPQYHPSAFFFHVFFLPISLFIIAFVWGGSIEKRKKKRELEELKLSWALDRIALKKHDEWAWKKNWEDSWKDRNDKK